MRNGKTCVSAIVILASLSATHAAGADLKPFVNQYCLSCHGEKKPKAGLSLHNLSSLPVKRAEIEAWRAVLEKIDLGEMPPKNSKQPSAEERRQFMDGVKSILKNSGETFDDAHRLAPVRGNYVDHETLFSGNPVEMAATRPRLWRLTGQAYEQFILLKNLQFRLGIKSYGNGRVRSPWELQAQKEFSDYAHAHRIGDADIEYHLRNVTRVANLMVQKFAGQRPGSSDAMITDLSVVLQAGKASTPEQINAAVIASFDKIFNRTLEPDDLERYAGFLAKNLQTLDAAKAVEQFLIATLLRPEVMYRIELPANPGERSIMPPAHLARALSFALTDSEPDQSLRNAVKEGKLTTRDEVRGHIERMLNEPSIANPRVLRFFQEYFGYTTAGDVFKDEVTLSEYGLKKNNYAPHVYVNDTDQLVLWILDQDRQVLRELLTTPKTFVFSGSGELTRNLKSYAEHLRSGGAPRKSEPGRTPPMFGYQGTGVPDAVLAVYEIKLHVKNWFDDRPYDMPAEHRMGILTHPSWLIAHTTNFDNHAIDRGRWIRERLLGGKIPEIPITVDATLPDEPHVPLRERMRVTKAEYCWTCHQHMDPLGLTFEQYDPFGRFRTQELVVDKEATDKKANKGRVPTRVMKNVPLDTTGMIAQSGAANLDGPVNGPHELIAKLANSERVEQVFVRHAFRFFVGRNETLADGPAIIAAHRAYKENNGSMKALIRALLTSDSFLYRAGGN